MPPSPRIISQILRLHHPRPPAPQTHLHPLLAHLRTVGVRESYFGWDTDPQKSDELFLVLQWPSDIYPTESTSLHLTQLLKDLGQAEPEVVATVEFEDGEGVRKALEAPVFQLCTIDLKPSVNPASLSGPLLKTFTDCYEAPGFTGGDWGQDSSVPGGGLHWYFLGWESRELHDAYQKTPLFWVEVNKLMPYMKGGWAHYIQLERSA